MCPNCPPLPIWPPYPGCVKQQSTLTTQLFLSLLELAGILLPWPAVSSPSEVVSLNGSFDTLVCHHRPTTDKGSETTEKYTGQWAALSPLGGRKVQPSPMSN